jgi:hypothetical protein
MSDPNQELRPPLSAFEKNLLGLVLLLIAGLLVCVGVFGLLWSLFCFLGGPDGRIGSWESFAFGGFFLVMGTALLVAGIYLTKAGLFFFRQKT